MIHEQEPPMITLEFARHALINQLLILHIMSDYISTDCVLILFAILQL